MADFLTGHQQAVLYLVLCLLASPADLRGAPGDQDGFTVFPVDNKRFLNWHSTSMKVRERLHRRHHRQHQGARLHGPNTQAAGQTTGMDAGQQRHHQPHQGRGER